MNADAMPPARRRPIPGMTAGPSLPSPPQRTSENELGGSPPSSSTAAAPDSGVAPRRRARSSSAAANGATREADSTSGSGTRERRPAADYATTRLVNFRIPVDLHDRYRQLIREAEQQHPRLRHLSLTEVIIALLEEGPATAKEIGELIRRKRADEHSA